MVSGWCLKTTTKYIYLSAQAKIEVLGMLQKQNLTKILPLCQSTVQSASKKYLLNLFFLYTHSIMKSKALIVVCRSIGGHKSHLFVWLLHASQTSSASRVLIDVNILDWFGVTAFARLLRKCRFCCRFLQGSLVSWARHNRIDVDSVVKLWEATRLALENENLLAREIRRINHFFLLVGGKIEQLKTWRFSHKIGLRIVMKRDSWFLDTRRWRIGRIVWLFISVLWLSWPLPSGFNN